MTVALYGAFLHATFVPGYAPFASAANLISGSNAANWKQWVVGAQFGAAGFTVGGAVGWDNNGRGGNYYTGVDNDSRFYTASVMYETGPWQMSLGWVGSYNNSGDGSCSISAIATGTQAATMGTVAGGSSAAACGAASTSVYFGGNPVAGAAQFGTESAHKLELGANYALGPGVKLFGGGIYNIASGPSNAVAATSWGILLGMDLRF